MNRKILATGFRNPFTGVLVGLLLELFNLMVGGLTTTLPNLTGGTFRLHHLWVGLVLVLVGTFTKLPFFSGIGIVLMFGDWFEHQRPDGTIAPFW